ncbi:MAG: UTP--glucose-1-phosphate uridylyltransferase [Gammaproteobacteria bacterium]
MTTQTTTQISSAIFPVAGLGTRTLPVTKITAKEMLNVVDKPVIQYAVQEAIDAGISEIVFVTAADKKSVEQHFADLPELEAQLLEKGKQDLYELIHAIVPQQVSIKAVIQEQPLGLGHAVLCARELIGEQPVAVILPDDLIINAGDNCLQQMLRQYQQLQCSVIATEEVPLQDTARYGIVEMQQGQQGYQKMLSIVEKPTPEAAPSRHAVVGRYILSAGIWRELQQTSAGSGNEIQLTDAIAGLLQHEEIYLCDFAGRRYDCGSRLGLLQANVELGLTHPQLGAEFARYLAGLAK